MTIFSTLSYSQQPFTLLLLCSDGMYFLALCRLDHWKKVRDTYFILLKETI